MSSDPIYSYNTEESEVVRRLLTENITKELPSKLVDKSTIIINKMFLRCISTNISIKHTSFNNTCFFMLHLKHVLTCLSKVERVRDLKSECADILKIPNLAIFFPMILIFFFLKKKEAGEEGSEIFS